MQSNLPLPRVEKTVFNGTPAWIKRPESTRVSRFVLLHNLLKFVMPQVLQPTGAVGGMPAIRQEAKRLESFRAASLPVPHVLALNDDSVVLSDTGTQLKSVLRNLTDPRDRMALMERAMQGVTAIHNAGLCHGRPFLKDMTIDEEDKLHFLDLEEDPTSRMPIKDAQARDVWLLLCSCSEFCEDPTADLSHLVALYISGADVDLTDHLRALGKSLRSYRRITGGLRRIYGSRDISGAYWSVLALEDL